MEKRTACRPVVKVARQEHQVGRDFRRKVRAIQSVKFKKRSNVRYAQMSCEADAYRKTQSLDDGSEQEACITAYF